MLTAQMNLSGSCARRLILRGAPECCVVEYIKGLSEGNINGNIHKIGRFLIPNFFPKIPRLDVAVFSYLMQDSHPATPKAPPISPNRKEK